MEQYKLGEMEKRFANLIWNNAPISSGELVKLCEAEFEWKKSTTYTMLKRLCQRGIFENKNGIVSSLMSKEDFLIAKGEVFLEESFNGSLPLFIAAFARRKNLSDEEVDELKNIIEQSRR